MTAAIVAGAVVVLIAAVMYMRGGDKADTAPPREVSSLRPQPRAPLAKERSARVEERLTELRDDVEHRQMGSANPPPNKREVPTMSAHKRAAMQDEDAEDDDEDPQEMEELKHTLLTNPDPEERIGAVLMLTGEEGPESLRMLLDSMDDPDPEVRLAVVEALGDRSEEISPDTLGSALRDPDAEVRFEAVSILGDMETPEARAMVDTARQDEDDDVRALAEGIHDFDDDEDDNDTGTAPGTPRPQPMQNGQVQSHK
jgi:HEAT repeat protein